MPASTLLKVGVLAIAALAAKTAYSAMCRKRAGEPHLQAPTQDAGKSADIFSTEAIQHDLSTGDLS